MNVIIFGLPGTGKTTLCKSLSEIHGLKYVTDYEILSKYGYTFENSLKIIDNDYFQVINAYFQTYKPKNCIFDFNYCISPGNISKLYDFSNSFVTYLGFVETSNEELFLKYEKKHPNMNKDELRKIIDMFFEVSRKYNELCNQAEIDFVSINGDRAVILKKLQNEISEIIKDE